MSADPRPAGTSVFADDFATDLGQWDIRPLGGRADGDGVASTGREGLVVVPTATHLHSGEPAFAEPPEPGGPDLRWAALAAHTSSAGYPGFDALAGTQLTVAAELSARAFGLDEHPYGDAVVDPRVDSRLGGGALITLDRESGVVCDVLLTEGRVFALYERLPRPGGHGAVFSYAVPAGDRSPDQWHEAEVVYDLDGGVVRWSVDDQLILIVDRVGRRLGPDHAAHCTADNGLADDDAAPRQLAAGLGLMAEQAWGQGARLAVRQFTISRSRCRTAQ